MHVHELRAARLVQLVQVLCSVHNGILITSLIVSREATVAITITPVYLFRLISAIKLFSDVNCTPNN